MNRVGLVLVVLLLVGGSIFAQDSAATHAVGDKFGGGTVFYVTPSGQHGLIVESTDIPFNQNPNLSLVGMGKNATYNAQEIVGNPDILSPEAKEYSDWRIPSFHELVVLSKASKLVGGLNSFSYLSDYGVNRTLGVTEQGAPKSASKNLWGVDFKNGTPIGGFAFQFYVRLIRSF